MIGRESRADTDSSAAGNFSTRVRITGDLQAIKVSSYIFDWCISSRLEHLDALYYYIHTILFLFFWDTSVEVLL